MSQMYNEVGYSEIDSSLWRPTEYGGHIEISLKIRLLKANEK